MLVCLGRNRCDGLLGRYKNGEVLNAMTTASFDRLIRNLEILCQNPARVHVGKIPSQIQQEAFVLALLTGGS